MMMKNFFTSMGSIFAILLIGLIGPVTVQSQDAPNLIPYTLFHDFETGELFGWEPYPYQQDIGYDALYFTRQSPTYNNSNYALARPVTANHVTELYQGFTRQLNLWTTEDTRLQVAVYFQSDRNPESLEISLGTFDGRRFFHIIEDPQANQWLEIDLPLSGFKGENGEVLEIGEHIQVVTLEGSYPAVYYLYTYTVLMDDFRINGERQRRFVAERPESINFDEFEKSILNKHYTEGETISLRVRPEENVALRQVSGRLINGEGDVIRNGIPFTHRNGSWENNSIHTVRSSDRRGRWTLELQGTRENGARVQWAFDFLVPIQAIDRYPRLLFSEEELSSRLQNETSPVAQRILENALADRRFMEINLDEISEGANIPTESFTAGPYGKYVELRRGQWRPPLYALSDIIQQGSLHYAFTGDLEAGERAREALIKLSMFNYWNAGWMLENKFWTYYPLGYVVQGVAVGYDLLHDLLSEDERTLVREAIMERALKPFYRDKVVMNRMPSHATNHLSVLVMGYGMAATAIYGDDPDNPYVEPYLSGILDKMEAFVHGTYYEDGSYAEPIGYHGHATNNIVQLFDVLERNFGLDYSTTTGVRTFYYMPILGTGRTGQIQDFGDFNVGNAFNMAHTRSQWFVKRLGDPYLYDYVKPFWEEGRGGFLGYLWFRDDIEPISRDALPSSRVFEARGMIMRSDWSDEATIIHKHTGPMANHYHYDQGSFQIQVNGQELLTDPGIGFGGYYGNMMFSHYNIQAVGHNVMLVDADPQSQKPAHYDNGVTALREWPRVTRAFAGEIADAVESDLATVYKDKLAGYNRTLLYTKRGPLFLFDRVESVSPEGHTYNWAFHIPMRDRFTRIAEWNDGRLTADRENSRLTLEVISTQIIGASIEDNRDRRHPETLVRLDSEPGLNQTEFLAVLWPEAVPANGRFGERPVTEAVEANGWIGARSTLGNTTHYGVFRSGGATTGYQVAGRSGQSGSGTEGGRSSQLRTVAAPAASQVAGFTTDANRFTASLEGSNLVRYYVEGGSFEGHGHSMNAGSPVTLAVLHHDGGTDAEVDASGSTRVSFTVPSRPSRVLLNGSSVRHSYENGRVSVQVPAGRHDIEVR